MLQGYFWLNALQYNVGVHQTQGKKNAQNLRLINVRFTLFTTPDGKIVLATLITVQGVPYDNKTVLFARHC